MINDRLIDRIVDVTEAIDEKVDTVADKVDVHQGHLLRPEIAEALALNCF